MHRDGPKQESRWDKAQKNASPLNLAEDRFKAQNIECRYIPTRILLNHQEKICIENE
jgi:hypothetical protein